jgi:hypothetical protein
MTPRTTRRELEIADHLWECLTRIAEDKGTDPQVVLNQAIYDLARRFNFLTPVPGAGGPAVASPPAPAAKKGGGAPQPTSTPREQPMNGGGGMAPQPKKAPAAAIPPKAATAAAPSLFVVNSAGEMTKVEKDQFIIGRSRTCDLVIASSKVSRRHCSVSRENGEFFIEDLGSPNGLWRDGVKVTKEKIRDGDEFMISDEVLKFVYRSPGRK